MSARVRATMNHALLHACISRNMEAPADSALMRLVLALRGLNAAEAAAEEIGPLVLIKAYVTVLITCWGRCCGLCRRT